MTVQAQVGWQLVNASCRGQRRLTRKKHEKAGCHCSPRGWLLILCCLHAQARKAQDVQAACCSMLLVNSLFRV